MYTHVVYSVKCEFVPSQIESGTMDGQSRVMVVSGLSSPWGLTIHQNYLYYTDLDYEVIERVEKNTGANMVVMRSGMSGLRALKVHARDSKTSLIDDYIHFFSEAFLVIKLLIMSYFRLGRNQQRLQLQQWWLSSTLFAQT